MKRSCKNCSHLIFHEDTQTWCCCLQMKVLSRKEGDRFIDIKDISSKNNCSDWYERKLLSSEDIKSYLIDFKNKTKQPQL